MGSYHQALSMLFQTLVIASPPKVRYLCDVESFLKRKDVWKRRWRYFRVLHFVRMDENRGIVLHFHLDYDP